MFIDARTADKLLRKQGFIRLPKNGGHVKYQHPDGRICVMRDPERAGAKTVNCARSLEQARVL